MARIRRGRQKIEIKKMTNERNLLVTFSKRRYGIFKKASELSTLCDVDVAVIVFSPGKKVFSFGHKSVDSVIQGFVNGAPPISSGPTELIQAYRHTNIRHLNAQLMQVLHQLEMKKKRAQELSKMWKARQAECWWQKPVNEMKKEQLEQLKLALEELQKKVTQPQTIRFQNLNNATQSLGADSNVMPHPSAMHPADVYGFGSNIRSRL